MALKRIYLSLGSNVGDREQNLQDAIDRLAGAGIRILRCSSVYETEPQDLADQPWFLNVVIEAETELMPMQLLSKIVAIEKEMGRTRKVAKGPRPIDIDVLFFGRFVIDTPQLCVPHPRLDQRRFVLAPMAELAPDFRHPVMRKSMRELLGRLKGQEVRRREGRLGIP
ncbi:MAG: 2-amino-4-hydroxy-6-hydroxymethyldihydropteridine diphosphokinase [Bryobacteraceae bacterium]